jgi:hypothetical protein
MSMCDDRSPNEPSTKARKRRRGYAAAGVAGLMVVAGGGYLIAADDDETATQQAGTVAPVVVPASEVPTPTFPATTATGGQTATADSVPSEPARSLAVADQAPAATPKNDKVRKKIEAARSKAAAEGHPLQRPLTAPPGVAAERLDSYREERRDLAGGGVLQVFSAKGNLSGQRQMLWAADDGESEGAARCTQNFRFSRNAEPAVRPTMLLCWRITDGRSVVVLSTAREGSPSRRQSVDALTKRWNRLG